jgi:anthranilate phosphoribosyltransferase
MMRELLPRLVGGERLTREESAAAIRAIVRGECDPAQVGAFLALLAQRGESAEELAGGAEALRSEAVPFPSAGGPLLDTCGTGGDHRHTFNVSTAVALVAAAAGARVAKHGNRSVSSRCGSADVLEALGAKVELGPRAAARALEATGFCFLFAPRYHPSMRRVAPVRQALGIRTLFNWMGPLANPARASHQLLGIPDPGRLELVARVLGALGVRRALVVHGAGGLDELSLEAGNRALLVEEDRDPVPVRVEADDLGLEAAPHEALRGGDAAENAAALRSVLGGERGPRRDLVLLNAAAALWVAERAASLEEGALAVARAIDTGAAEDTLQRYISMSLEPVLEEEEA